MPQLRIDLIFHFFIIALRVSEHVDWKCVADFLHLWTTINHVIMIRGRLRMIITPPTYKGNCNITS
jgi:hypothetical protein